MNINLVFRQLYNATSSNDNTIKDFFKKSKLANDEEVSIDFIRENKTEVKCVFKKITIDENWYFGLYGELKDVEGQRATIVETKTNHEIDKDLNIKYTVYFLVDFGKNRLVYIPNKNGGCFEEALKHISNPETQALVPLILEPISIGTWDNKIRNAKRIKHILIHNDSKSMSSLLDDLNPLSIGKLQIKVSFKRKSNVSNIADSILQIRGKNKNKNSEIEFVDEFDNTIIQNFLDDVFFLKMKLDLPNETYRNKNFMFDLLKNNIDKTYDY